MRRGWGLAGLLLCLLAGCVALPVPTAAPASEDASEAVAGTPWARQSANLSAHPPAPAGTHEWQHYKLPGKQSTRFAYARKDGRDAMAVTAVSSASMLRHAVRVEPAELGSVRFSWKVPELMAQTDMALRESDDSPVRIILAFEGDRSRLSTRNALLSELARTLTGEEMPYATLMYVWCNKREPGSVIISPRTDRIRGLVVESGPRKLNQWLDYERNIRADYERAFGEAPGALVGVAIMTDSDNTRSTARAWYGPVQLRQQVSAAR